MVASDGRHFKNFSFDQFNPIVFGVDAEFSHSIEIIDGYLFLKQWYGHDFTPVFFYGAILA